MEANKFLTYALKQDVPQTSSLVLFLNGVVNFYSVVAVHRSTDRFTLKAAEFSVSALQTSQHFCYF